MYEPNGCNERKCCIDVVIFVLSILFALVLGIIIGAVTDLFAILGLGAFVAVAVLLGVLILVRVVMLICCRRYC